MRRLAVLPHSKGLSTLSPLHHYPTTGPHMNTTIYRRRIHFRDKWDYKDKVVVIMGATGSGKSRLSVELATRFFPSAAEIINSDKMQVYRGLDITTNKIPMRERLGVPHHLIGEFDPIDSHPEFTASDFRSAAASAISRIASGRRLPIVVGGSNSFIYSLLAERFDPDSDVFNDFPPGKPTPICTELRFNCCFLWVDVSPQVLDQYLIKRVDDMLASGMFDELSESYECGGQSEWPADSGLKQAIGVPEFERYFNDFGGGARTSSPNLWDNKDTVRRRVYEEAVRSIKDNTCQLAKRQLGKIQRLSDAGWCLHRINATDAFRAGMGLGETGGRRRSAVIWERQVVEPSVKIVKRFLED